MWFSDVEFTHMSAQGVVVEPKDFSRTVLSADFAPGLLKYPNNMVSLMPHLFFRTVMLPTPVRYIEQKAEYPRADSFSVPALI